MKKILLTILLTLIAPNSINAEQFTCKVISVHDGDTFTCADNTKIRVWGIDTPEVDPAVSIKEAREGGGYAARDYLRSVILDKNLQCTKKGKSYKRIVAQCFVNGDDIALLLLKNGYAKELKRFSKGYYSQQH